MRTRQRWMCSLVAALAVGGLLQSQEPAQEKVRPDKSSAVLGAPETAPVVEDQANPSYATRHKNDQGIRTYVDFSRKSSLHFGHRHVLAQATRQT